MRANDERSGTAEVGVRVQEIVDTANRAAASIRAEAQAQAAAYLEQRRLEANQEAGELARELTELRESLSARAEKVERQVSGLLEAIDGAVQRVGKRPSSAGVVAGPDPDAPAEGREPENTPELIAFPGTGAQRRVPERARIRAVQMAEAGLPRDEIERMLRAGFGLSDPAPIADEALRSQHR